ncbi:APC family permease [Streptomyces sp. NPDC050263]|uniref:APC family permease n=1 Tax=Streptomyces sp. NPDC050263 TaxID=3155037 RepID=UPI00342EA3DE
MSNSTGRGLQANVLGTFDTVVMAVADSAPAYSIAATTAVLAGAVGLAGPAALLYCATPMLGIALAFSRLSRIDVNAGAGYSWVGRTLRPFLGFISGWALVVSATIFMVAGSLPAGSMTLALFDDDLADNTALYLDDPTPWASLISVARLYPSGVRRQELARWWDELHRRDPYSMEGHLQVLHYYSARWHGSHGLMYDFARDAAGVAPPGCPLPVLVQYARVEEFRHTLDAAQGRTASVALSQHWKNDGAVGAVRRTWERWITGRAQDAVAPGELRDFNYLAHAACSAGAADVAAPLLGILGRRATRTPWSFTGDPAQQLVKWRKEWGVRD